MKRTQQKDPVSWSLYEVIGVVRIANEQRQSSKGLVYLHLLSVTLVLLPNTCAASVLQEKPCFHSQSAPPFLSLPLPPSLTLLSPSSRFPSNRHTSLVHYYSPGFTKTRIIALLSTTVSREAGERRTRRRRRKEMQATSYGRTK